MASESAAEQAKYLVFRLGDQTYALPADQVKEIVSSQPCFALPFTPDWVRGVLNRHGVPFAILDLQVLLGGKPSEAEVHILLNLADDQVAIRIDEVKEILRLPSSRYRRLAAKEGGGSFFAGALALDSGDVFVFQLSEILRKFDRDVQV